MKRLLLLMVVVCSALATLAQGKSLFITFNDGSKAEFAMTDNPAITMTDGTMTVVAGTTTLNYELWRVKQFTFGTSTAIREVSGIQLKSDKVRIFTLDGKAVNVSARQDQIDLSSLASGVYIININGNTLKFRKP